MKRQLVITAMMLCGIAAQAQNVAEYVGKAEVSQERMDVRNSYYWSVGTEVDGIGHILGSRMVHSCGIGQADYRLCTYEDGTPIVEDGKLFFCMSCRMSGIEPKVASYDISTCQFKLIGAIQGMQADTVRNAIAPHIIYNRKDSHWYVFAHWGKPHNLCVSKCVNDIRYGYNEIEFQLLDYQDRVRGDEDNFVYYDSTIKRWVLIYSRGSTTLARQESRSIDRGYRLVASSDAVKTLTGINVTTIGGRKYIVSGYGQKPDNDAYKVFDINSLQYVSDLNLDIPTGGWRGWGTILSLPEGTSTKYQLLTFDRVNPTGFNNWQYGTMYLYEARERGSVAPADLHFVRKFAQRNTYNMELEMGKMDFSFKVFLPKSNPYPVLIDEGVTYSQVGESVEVKGKGRLELLGGTHCPGAEYVLNLAGLSDGETRYLRIGTSSSTVACIRFSRDAQGLRIASGDEILYTVPGVWDSVRVITTGTTACFVVR